MTVNIFSQMTGEIIEELNKIQEIYKGNHKDIMLRNLCLLKADLIKSINMVDREILYLSDKGGN